MSENEESVEGLCGDHKYAREFIDVAHGRLKDFTVEDRIELWHDYAWSDTTVICDKCVGVSPVVVTYDTTWAEIDENDPEGSIYFLIKVQLGSDVAWGCGDAKATWHRVLESGCSRGYGRGVRRGSRGGWNVGQPDGRNLGDG